VGNNNYWCVKSSQSTISKTCRASCAISTWTPTKNYLRWCKSRHRANLITTLNGCSFLGLYIINNFLTWVQHMHIYLSTKIQNRNSFMEAINKGLFTTRIFIICSFASGIEWLFPKSKVDLPFPFEAFETKHYILPTFLMLNVDLLHLSRSM